MAIACFLKEIEADKQEVNRLALIAVKRIIVRGAEVCGLKWPCRATNTMEPATTLKEVRKAWFDNGTPANTMRIAWMMFYFPTELYCQATVGTRHQEAVEREILIAMRVNYFANAADENRRQGRTAVQQTYTLVFNHVRANMLRRSNMANNHKVTVRIEKPKDGSVPASRRQKTQFFVPTTTAWLPWYVKWYLQSHHTNNNVP